MLVNDLFGPGVSKHALKGPHNQQLGLCHCSPVTGGKAAIDRGQQTRVVTSSKTIYKNKLQSSGRNGIKPTLGAFRKLPTRTTHA